MPGADTGSRHIAASAADEQDRTVTPRGRGDG